MDDNNTQQGAALDQANVSDPVVNDAVANGPSTVSNPVVTDPVVETGPWDGVRDQFLSRFEDADKRASVEKWVGRYATPADAIEAAWKNNEKFLKGEVVPALPKNATPEQIKAYNEANGVPEKPEGYFAGALPEGLVIGDADKPVFDKLAEHMHAKGMPAKYMHEVASWYNSFAEEMRDQNEQNLTVMDTNFAKEAQATLKKQLGPDYQLNVNHVNSFVSRFNDLAGEDAVDILTQARGPDGRLLLDNPAVFRAFSGMAREYDPIASTVGGGPTSVTSLQDRLAALHKIRDSGPAGRDKYFAEGMNTEASELMAAIEKRK